MVIDCSSIIDIEYTALKMLAEAEEKLQREGVRLWLAALNPSVFTTVSRSRVGQTMGPERMFFNVQTAVERYEKVTIMRKTAAVTKTGFREAMFRKSFRSVSLSPGVRSRIAPNWQEFYRLNNSQAELHPEFGIQ
jgi:hypothetical protein